VVELVVEGLGLQRAFAVQHGQRAEAAGFVDVAAVAACAAFGDQAVALPDEFGGLAVHFLGDAPAEGVVSVADLAAIGQLHAHQAVLAVVAVLGDQLLPGAAAFAEQVAVGVVVVVAVPLHQQAVALYVDLPWVALLGILGQQVARRVVGEAFRQVAAHGDQAVQRVVVVTARALAAVFDAGEVATGVVAVAPLVQRALALADLVGEKPALFVVLVLAEQLALLALAFPAEAELVAGQALAVQVDGAEFAARPVAVVEGAAIREPAMAQPPQGVIAVLQGRPALVFAGQAVLQVVLVGQRPFAVVHAHQAAQGIVAIVDLAVVGLRSDQQAARGVALVAGDEFAAVLAILGLLQQVPVEVVGIGASAPVETGFPADKATGVVVEAVQLATLVLDLAEQQPGVVIAVAQLAAVGVDAPGDEVQATVVFVTGHPAELIALRRHLAVGVVFVGAAGAPRQGDLAQAAQGIPLEPGDGALFVLAGDLAAEYVIAIAAHAAIRQAFLDQLAQAVP